MAGLGRHGGGLRGARPIDPGWSAHHRPVAEAAMTATVTLRRRDGTANDSDAWSPTEGRRSRTAAPGLWSGPARLQAQASAVHAAELAGQKVTTRTYLLTIPLDAPLPRVGTKGDVFTVDACPDDPAAVGRALRAIDVQVGSLAWERDVIVSDDLTANNR